jgi:predicted TIM-barrel fold metal-dependent hydrolase
MRKPFIIDAHVHTGYPGIFFSPEVDSECLLGRMDGLQIQYAINLCSMRALAGQQGMELEKRREEFEESGGRIFYLGFYNPHNGERDLAVIEKAVDRPGFKGIKIHPSLNKISADDDSYEPVWRFAADRNLPIVAHTWSVSSYNPVQVFSTPEKFERFVIKYRSVRFVLGHSGGRGAGRHEAVRMAKQYKNVYMDFGGDIYSYRYFEKMAVDVPENKVLFGSDYPWLDSRSHLTRVFLAGITTELKRKILRDNALEVYRLENK